MLTKSISDLSCDESPFNNAKVIYGLALNHNEYKSEMKFDQQPSTKRNRNRKSIWFNPPFTWNVKTNIGKVFFSNLYGKTFRKIMDLKNIQPDLMKT